MPYIRKHIIFVILLLYAAFACKKGSVETDYNPNLQVANNIVIAERAYSEVFNIFHMVVNDPELKELGSKEIFGANCSYQETPQIRYVIDYLHYYTSCPDGKIRKGIITAILDKDFTEPGAIAELSFSDYTVEYLRLDSINMIRYIGQPAAYEHIVPSATLTFIDSVSSVSYHWQSTKTFTFTEGMATPYEFEDDLFTINGEGSGTDVGGAIFTAVVDEALGNYFNCRWIRKGKILITTPDLAVKNGYIQYIGQDTCTNQVMYYFNENPFYDRFILH